jgi:hypothetical protein
MSGGVSSPIADASANNIFRIGQATKPVRGCTNVRREARFAEIIR